jgi:ABC-type transporter Mla MlaB component
MKEKKMENVDRTIDTLCEWIQKELKQSSGNMELTVIPEMAKALAELVSAKATAEVMSR